MDKMIALVFYFLPYGKINKVKKGREVGEIKKLV